MNRVFKSTLLAASTILIAATAANAADLPNEVLEPVAAAPQPQAFDWSGFYIGGNAGIDFGGDFNNNFGADLDKGVGFVGGGVIGYNHQIDKFVFGIEGDFNYLGGDASSISPSGPASADLDFISTFTARAGYTPIDRLLTYVEGGFALGRPDFDLGGTSDRSLAAGYVVGAGAEYALTNNWITGVEYNYVDLQNRSFNLGSSGASSDFDTHQVKFNLKYKF